MNYSEYIIDLARRYKLGGLSKQMFSKYIECALNCFEYEIKPPKDIAEAITLAIEINSIRTNLYMIMSQPKPKPGLLRDGFAIVGSKGDEELILPDGKILTHKKHGLINLPKIINADKNHLLPNNQ